MDLRRWTHIVALADRRSFVAAAEQVHLSQPALSRSIQAAESELGLALFERRSSAVVPTPAGEFVIARARQLVFDGRCLHRDIDLYRNRSLGDVAFGVGPYPAATFLTPLLAALHREHPGVDMRVEISNWQLLVKRLLDEDIEFFVADTRDLPLDRRLAIRPLRREAAGLYVRAGHPLDGRAAPSLKTVWTYGIASVRLPVPVRAALASLLGIADQGELAVALECDDLQVLKTAVLGCDLVLGAPHAAVRDELDAGRLRALPVAGLPPLSSETGVVTLRGRTPSPMAERVIEQLPIAASADSSKAAVRGAAKRRAGRRGA